MSRRVVTVVAAVLALVLVIGGTVAVLATVLSDRDSTVGSDDSSAAPQRPVVGDAPDEGATEPPSPELASFYSQELAWQECEGDEDNECATLEVPLDYADPGGETIDIAVLKVPAGEPDQRVGQLVVNPGGPGAPGTSYAAAGGAVWGDALLDHFDIVGFDPRGTGESSPVDCLSDAQLDAYIASDPDPDTAAEEEAYTEATARVGAGCVERSGDLASHVTTVEAARDIDVLRAALGRAQLDYFGASYGTKLGATYAQLFPDKVGRFVLDGAVDPTLSSKELNLEQSAGFETALRAYVQNCTDSGDCFLGDSVDEGIEAIKTFVGQVDDNPLPTDGERDLTVGNAFYGIVAPLYNRDYWTILSQALRSGLDGDGTLLLQLSDLYSSRGDDGTYTDNSTEANYAINCTDDPTAIGADEVAAVVPEFEESSPTFGEVFAWSLTNCSGVQAEATEPSPTISAAGAAPIVVVGTSRDPATPYQWSVSLAEQLESGVLVSRDGDGHTAYMAGNACIDGALESYLVDDTVPADGLQC